MTKLTKAVILLLVVLLTLGAVAGCSGKTTTPPTSEGEGEGTYKNLIVGYGGDTEGIDPQFIEATYSFTMCYHVFEPLVLRNFDGEFEGRLAESWELIDDLTWEFKLRQGVKFHSGNEFNAHAVEAMFDRVYNNDLVVNRYKEDLHFDRCEIVDDYTIRVKTTEPNPTLLEDIFAFGIGDPAVYEGNYEAIYDVAVGTGPYKFKEWVRDDHFTIVVNEDYWGDVPEIDEIVFRVIPESSTRVAELLSGGVDIINNPPIDQIESLKTATTSVLAASANRDCALVVNMAIKPFDDVRVRQAINYAVDKEAINNALLGGKAELFGGICMPPNENTDLKPYPYDPDKAKALLADAGVTEGTPITLQTTTGRYLREKEITQAVASYLDDVGFKTTVELLDYSVMSEKRNTRTISELNFIGLGGYFSGIGELAWPRDMVSNNSWVDEQYEAVYQQALKTMDDVERKRLTDEAQRIVHDDAVWLFLWRQPTYYGINNRLQGFSSRRDEFMFFWNCDIVE
ncbi:MAG TPA: hypothetical protein GX016_09860 [Firmicutes bacterium]|nr:hypothetical protein [Bacillota bacterium]